MPALPGTPTADETPGDDRHGQPRLDGRHDLLAAPAEDIGVATLEPHDREAGEGARDHDPLDLVLGHRVVSRPLAHVDDLRPRGEAGDVTDLGEPVGEHDVGLREGADPGERQQLETPGTRPHEDDPAPGRVRDRLGHDGAPSRERVTDRGPAGSGPDEHREPRTCAHLVRHVPRRGGDRDHGTGPLVTTHDGGGEARRPHDEHGQSRQVGLDQHGGLPSQLVVHVGSHGRKRVFRPRFRPAMPR